MGPSVVLAPSFAPCFTLLKQKLPCPDRISITSRSTLVVSGQNVIIEELDLDGALVIQVEAGGKLTIKSLKVVNQGWTFTELDDASQATAEEQTAIRGFTISKHEQRVIKVAAGEKIVIENNKARKASLMSGIRLDVSMRRKKKKSAQQDPDRGLPTVIKVEQQSAGCVPTGCAIL